MQAFAHTVRRSWSMRLGSLVRAPLMCAGSTSATDAAALMSRERARCLLVPQPEGFRIVTDQDLALGVLAAGRSPRTPIGELAVGLGTPIPSNRSASEALLSLLESGVRHAPVVDARRRVLGVVSDTDLAGLDWRSPLHLQGRIESAPDAGNVAAAGLEIPRVVCEMVEDGVEPMAVGRVVTLLIDALTRRLIELALEHLGEPPVPWAWLTLGSAARREQAATTDQDHALAFDLHEGDLEETDGYFLGLAKAVTTGLEASGIPRCHADVVAENRSLRRPLEHWVSAFNEWMDDPRLEAGRQASILFDQRRSAGPLEAERVLEPVIGSAPTRPRFVARLAKQAVDTRPPGARARGVAADGRAPNRGVVDIKRAGLTPIVNLARSYALEAGITEPGTLDRLALAAERGRIDERTRSDLVEAYRLVWQIRLRHHVGCAERGRPVDDLVDLRSLGSLPGVQLQEAFRIVRHEQRSLRRRHVLRFA